MESALLRQIFLEQRPLLDVRAPVEFAQGAFPCAQNIPLLDDEQRRLIGTRYKEQGQDAAIALGWEFASPAVIAARVEAWQQFVSANPNALLYCFRGGLRSRLSQQLMREHGIDIEYIDGGYKRMRRFLIDSIERLSSVLPLRLISGRTGSGKTLLVHALNNCIDLEGLARHRGSAFGAQLGGQPSQIDFENTLAIQMLQHEATSNKPLLLEDEGRLIGSLSLPVALKEAMTQAPLIVLQTGIEQRVEISLRDYVTDPWPQYQTRYGAQAMEQFSAQVLGNLHRIRKRLGGERYTHMQKLFSEGLSKLEQADTEHLAFREGIAYLLQHYYDPMYDYQRSLRQGQIVFEGTHDEIVQWLPTYLEQFA
jgi:tRNA 2-selenouridine synthase